MKKFVKGSLITAGILAALGCIFCFIGMLAGGRNLIYFIRNDDDLEHKLEAAEEKLDRLSGFHIGGWHILDREELSEKHSEEHFQADQVRNLVLSVGAGELELSEKEVSDGTIDIYAQGIGTWNMYLKGDTLYVEGFTGIHHSQFYDCSGNVINVEIPKGMRFDEVETEAGAGVMEISSFTALELEASAGAGEIFLHDLDVQEISADIGAGRMEAANVSAREADINVGMGECIYRGAILGNLDAECGMGNMEFLLKGKEQDHNYEIDCSAGNIEIGDLSFSAFAAERYVDNHAASTFDILCNMGNITVRFEE